jgi:hypothetical protein
MQLHRNRPALLAVAVALVVAGCGTDAGSDATASSDAPATAPSGAVAAPAEDDGPDPSTGPVVQDVGITVFTAADLDPSVAEAIGSTLDVARDAWGLRWAMEYWVFGTDADAAVALIDEFCTLRDTFEQWNAEECFAREANDREPHTMLSYQQLGAEAVSTGQPMGSAGLNGSPEWTLHRFASSAPWGLMDEFGVPADEDLKTVFHEYWHAVQSEHLDADLPFEVREELMGPVWFVEGSAEYMGQYQRARARADGLLPDVPAGDFPFVFAEQMRGKLGLIDQELAGDCAGRRLTTLERYEDPCSFLGYEMGSWAIAYLESITEQGVLLTGFHPNVQDLGWLAAFEATTGMTLDAFDAAFHDFIAGSTDARMAILPDVGGA